MNRFKTGLLVITLFANAFVFATGGTDRNDEGDSEKKADPSVFNWGDNEKIAKENYMLLNNAVAMKDYQTAMPAVDWLLSNTPNLNISLYINAAKVLEKMEGLEKDPSKRKELQNRVLSVYDKRIELYGDEANVLNRKGMVAWSYLHRRPGTADDLYNLYTKIYQLNHNDMYIRNAKYYFRSAIDELMLKKISKEDAINLYSNLQTFLNVKAEQSKPGSRNFKVVTSTRESLEKDFDRAIDLNCNEIKSIYGQKYQEKQTLELAKKINGFMRKNASSGDQGCLRTDLFVKTLNHILTEEPSAKNYKLCAKIHSSMGETEQAYAKYAKALELEEVEAEKAFYYLELAKIEHGQGQFAKARANYLNTVKADPTQTSVYSKIGDMYYSSANSCASDDVLQSKAAYIAAYLQYKKAGNTGNMAKAKAQFPTVEEIFVRGKKVGETISTGCWIGESVALQSRD